MIKNYGILDILLLSYFKIRTKILFKNARIIRFPFRMRGKKFINVGEGFTTGFNCRLDAFTFGERSDKCLINIGRNVQINDYVHIGAINNITIGDNVLIASKVFITDHDHGSYSGSNQDSPETIPNQRQLISAPVIIEENVWIGEFVSILKGVRIGKGSIIGTMSVVTKDIPPYSIAVGSPAKVIKQFDFDKKEWVLIK